MKTIKRMCKDVKKYWGYAVYAAKSDLKAEVADSYLNWIWWILEPLCLMFVYSFIFGIMLNRSEPYFAVFIFVGLTLWNFFNQGITTSVSIVRSNKAIISKVYVPKYILLLSKNMVHAFKMVISFGIILIMLLFYRVPINPLYLLYIPLIIIALILVTFALGLHLLHLGVFISDLKNITAIVMRVVFYMTGIFFNIESLTFKSLPPITGTILAKVNPTALIITSMRRVLLYEKQPEWQLLLILIGVSLFLALWGIAKIYKFENTYAKSV